MSLQNNAIAVLGAGSWGTALAIVLARKGQVVKLWDQDQSLLAEIARDRQNQRYIPGVDLPDNILVCRDVNQLFENTQDILMVVPSHAFSKALQGIKPFLTQQHRIVWATKGLDPNGEFLHHVAERELGMDRPYAMLSGPSFAKEVAIGLPTAVMIASKNNQFKQDLVTRFHYGPFRVYTTDDLVGVQFSAVVKNVLAVAVGISDGIELGANARAALITRGLAEMMRLGEALGAKRDTLMGLAGCGDVILTCTDNQSRNRRFGLALAKGLNQEQALLEIGQVVEAVYNVEQLYRLAQKQGIDLPIAEQVFKIMKEGISPREALDSLLSRPPKSE